MNTDTYYERMADEYYNSERFEPTEDIELDVKCIKCSHAYNNEKEEGICPSCEFDNWEKGNGYPETFRK